MSGVLRAFGRGVASQMQPAMLALLVVPFVVAIVFWALTAWFVWTPLTDWLAAALLQGDGWLRRAFDWSGQGGMAGARSALGVAVALLVLLPLMFVTAVAIVGVIAMPVVNRHLSAGPYRDVARRGSSAIVASLWNAVSSAMLFMVGYLASMPLWLLFGPLALVVPWFWWSWLTARIMRFDSLAEHADPAERRMLIRRWRRQYFGLSLAVTALNYVPPLFLVTPVLSALCFGHFSLAALRQARLTAGDGAAPAPAGPGPTLSGPQR